MHLKQIIEICGTKFFIYLIIIQLFIKGLLYGMIESLILPISQLIGLDGIKYQITSTIAEIPWSSAKPIFGILSDNLSIFGYKKKYYIVLTNIIGSLFALLLAIFLKSGNPIFICFCFFAIQLQISVVDLLTEAKYAEIMKNNPDSGSNIVSFVNALNSIGSLISVLIIGFLADLDSYFIYSILLYVCFGISLMPLIPTLLGWLSEIKLNSEINSEIIEINELIMPKTSTKWKNIFVFTTGCIGAIVSVVLVFNTLAGTIITSICLTLSLLLSYKFFDKIIVKACIYRCCTYLLYWGFSGAMDYYMTANNDCVPNGPHFSYMYYITWTGIVGAIVSFLGTIVYQVLFGKSKIRNVLIVTTIISSLFSCFDLIIVKRWNLTIHIPDKWFYMLGDQICYNLIDMLNYIPLMTLISKNVEDNAESTTYGYISGISNLARILSYLIGSYAMQWFQISTIIPCNFQYLWLLILVGHIAIPLLLIPLSFWLIPNISVVE